MKFPGRNDLLYDCSSGARLYPDWTGVYNLPGANYRPAPAGCGNSNVAQNGVYKDFGNYVRRIPTRWGNVRVSRVNEVNLGLFKNFRFTEQIRMQFRFESFNAFNHVRFPEPETNPGSANFGRVRKEQFNSPRMIQMALKISF
jgi:hypothetical protein